MILAWIPAHSLMQKALLFLRYVTTCITVGITVCIETQTKEQNFCLDCTRSSNKLWRDVIVQQMLLLFYNFASLQIYKESVAGIGVYVVAHLGYTGCKIGMQSLISASKPQFAISLTENIFYCDTGEDSAMNSSSFTDTTIAEVVVPHLLKLTQSPPT